MLVRNLSLASALTLVGLGLFANAVVHLAAGGQGRACAEHRRGEEVPVPSSSTMVPSLFAEDRIRDGEGGAGMAAMGAGDGCVEGEPMQWFGAVRELPECWFDCYAQFCHPRFAYQPFQQTSYSVFNEPFSYVSVVDVNADGVDEAMFGLSMQLVDQGVVLASATLLWKEQSEFGGGVLVRHRSCVLGTAPILDYLLSRFPSIAWATFRPMGWRDLDADGDLDLLVSLDLGSEGRRLWLENVGCEASQPLTGDLNDDGSVNAADLTMLLGGWTGN